ncbi:MAG: hypothetical protein LBM93_04575 [Oscillospiraceae bacterium]|jgi:hypothetical protein|nr:hypothetical protein [Oscillospiraceae bacterium]
MVNYSVNVDNEKAFFFEQLLTNLNFEFFGRDVPNEETVEAIKEADGKFENGTLRSFKSAAEMRAALLAEDDDD